MEKILNVLANFFGNIRNILNQKDFWLPNQSLVTAMAKTSSIAASQTASVVYIDIDVDMIVTHIRVSPTPTDETVLFNVKNGNVSLFRNPVRPIQVSSDQPLPGTFKLEAGMRPYIEITTNSSWTTGPFSVVFLGKPA